MRMTQTGLAMETVTGMTGMTRETFRPGTARLLRGMNLAVQGILTVTAGEPQKQTEHPARQMGTALCPWSHLL